MVVGRPYLSVSGCGGYTALKSTNCDSILSINYTHHAIYTINYTPTGSSTISLETVAMHKAPGIDPGEFNFS